LGIVLFHAEQGFRTIKGYQEIPAVIAAIEVEQAEKRNAKAV